MNSIDLVESFSEFKDVKTLIAQPWWRYWGHFSHFASQKYESDENFDIIVNTEKGDLEIWHKRSIVEDGTVENPVTQISLSDALKIEPDFSVGEETYEEVSIESFGRRAILAARQALVQRIMELEKDEVYKNIRIVKEK